MTFRLLILVLTITMLLSSHSMKSWAGQRTIQTGMFGLWGLPDMDLGLKMLRDNGFQLAIVGLHDLDKIKAHGLRGLVSFDLKLKTVQDPIKWGEFLADVASSLVKYKDHPAVFAWYPVDEPDLKGIPVEKIRELNDTIRRYDNMHPIFVVVNRPDKWGSYIQLFDILGVDKYMTVNRMGSVSSPDVVRDKIIKLKKDVDIGGVKKPIYAVIGAFDLRARPGEKRSIFHKPSVKEFREMVDICLQQKVDGILVYTLAIRRNAAYYDWNLLEDDPALWNEVKHMPEYVERNRAH